MSLTENQLNIFLTTVYAGLALGLLYDGVRVVRAILHSRTAAIVLDVAYFAAAFLAAVAVFYYVNRLEIRLYTFAGLAAGFLIYVGGFSLLIRSFANKFRAKAREKRRVKAGKEGNDIE